MDRQKRVAAIHDISCFGKCSLTVALPVISAAGIECSVIPTAVLSTHTGGFTGYTYRDLTEDIEEIARHWKALSLPFDAVYTGYLGSFEQVEIVKRVFDLLRGKNTKIIVDPVMADHGLLYKSFSPDFPAEMKKLCQKADVIVPNLSEAAFLLDEEYREGPYEKSYIEGLLRRLAALGPKQVVLTGVYLDDQELGAAAYDCTKDKVTYVLANRVDGLYHGTGDVFASALTAALLSDKSLPEAVRVAVDFTVLSIAWTQKAGTDNRFGVNFERHLPDLLRLLA